MKDLIFDDIVRESVEMMMTGDVESACRLTGEALASFDSALRNHEGNIGEFVAMAALHATLLRRAQLDVDAVGCGLIALCTADFYNSTDYADMMDLMAVTVAGMMSAVNKLPQNEDTMVHVAPMLILSAFLLEYWCSQAQSISETTREHSFKFAQNLVDGVTSLAGGCLRAEVDGKLADPKEAKPILAEIIGHASALGLIEV